jgi:hypothetical protein
MRKRDSSAGRVFGVEWANGGTAQQYCKESGVAVRSPGGPIVPQLTPGHPYQMLGEAIRHLKSLPRDAARRADAFEALARQIETHSGGNWSAARGTGTDGSTIFLGRQGEGLVVAPDGRIYRGAIGRGIDIAANGLCPNFNTLTPLD